MKVPVPGKRQERLHPYSSAWFPSATPQRPLLRELDAAETEPEPIVEETSIAQPTSGRLSRNVFNGKNKKPLEVPVDANGIVKPEHYFVFVYGQVPKKYRKREELGDNWQHMVYPAFMHNNRSLAYQLYGEAGFNELDQSKLAIYKGLPYNQIKLDFYTHMHYHHVHEDHVPPPESIDVVDQYIEEASILDALGAVTLSKCDLGVREDHEDSYHDELYEMYSSDQQRLIKNVGSIEVIPWLTVKSAVKRMTEKAPDPVFLEFSDSINADGSRTLPIRIPSTTYMRNLYTLRYRSDITEPGSAVNIAA